MKWPSILIAMVAVAAILFTWVGLASSAEIINYDRCIAALPQSPPVAKTQAFAQRIVYYGRPMAIPMQPIPVQPAVVPIVRHKWGPFLGQRTVIRYRPVWVPVQPTAPPGG